MCIWSSPLVVLVFHVAENLMECHQHQIFKMCICMALLVLVLLLPQILLRLKYISLQLYEPKLKLKSHIVELQYARVFLLSMTTYLWMLRNRRCCDALFVKQRKFVILISTNDLFYEKALLRIINLMGSLPRRPMLNLCFQNWLFLESWPLLRNLLMQVIFNNLGRSSLGHLGVQSQHILELHFFTRSLMRHNINFLRTC